MAYLFIRDGIARETIGKAGDKYVPLLFSLFFFVLIANVWGIIPGAQFPVNSRLAFPAGLALVVWLLYMFLGMKHQGPIKFFTNMMFPPGCRNPSTSCWRRSNCCRTSSSGPSRSPSDSSPTCTPVTCC